MFWIFFYNCVLSITIWQKPNKPENVASRNPVFLLANKKSRANVTADNGSCQRQAGCRGNVDGLPLSSRRSGWKCRCGRVLEVNCSQKYRPAARRCLLLIILSEIPASLAASWDDYHNETARSQASDWYTAFPVRNFTIKAFNLIGRCTVVLYDCTWKKNVFFSLKKSTLHFQ